jgi:CheY-like chemotaxis protein
MTRIVRQPVFYPASVVFLDDSTDFLHALRGIFSERHLTRFFTKPCAALRFISSRRQAASAGGISGSDYKELERKGGNALGRDLLTNDSRFEEVAAVVVDYEMPEMDGVEFLASIKDVPCTKILLTGKAGEAEAVDAFNAGLIDFYLKKSDADMARKLAAVLADANQRHCAERGQIGVHDVGSTYCDPRTVAVMNEIVDRERIAEYYWRSEQDVVLMFDCAGNPSIFVAWNESDWTFQCEVAADASGPSELRTAMAARRIMPLFWPFQTYRPGMTNIRSALPLPIPRWLGAFYSWTRLDSLELGFDPVTSARSRQIFFASEPSIFI